MKPETAGKIKYGVWGLIVGGIIVMITGFAWGGWTTSRTTKTMTDEAVFGESVGDLCCPIYDGRRSSRETQGIRGNKYLVES